MTNAFIHRPKRLANEICFHPSSPYWGRVWDAAKAQDWWQPNVGCVGNDKGYFYFQIPGLTTGFARVEVR